jgi:hypothetical protein
MSAKCQYRTSSSTSSRLVAHSRGPLVVRPNDALLELEDGRRARRDAASGESLSESVTIIAFVGNKRLGVWQHWIDQSRALMVTHLSFGEKKDNWPAGAIANRVQFGV